MPAEAATPANGLQVEGDMSVSAGPAKVPPGAPAMARQGLPETALEHLAGARVDAARHLLLAWVFGLAFVACLVLVAVLACRPALQPFILQAAGDGAVLPAGRQLAPYAPGQAERRYFLAQWSSHLLSLDARLSAAWLAQAYGQTRGKAQVEFTDWVRSTGPLARLQGDPSLTRVVRVSSVSLLEESVALVRVQCELRSLSNPTVRIEKYLLTLHYATITPDREEAVLRNPIGLQVTDFQVGEDLEK